LEQGAVVKAHDPAVKDVPEQYKDIQLCSSPLEAAQKADALVIATEWPDYRSVSMPEAVATMAAPRILDSNRFLANTVEGLPGVTYVAVGKAIPA
jgi:UDPglucose 6-dehydrogenase